MEHWALIKNALIKKIDSVAIEPLVQKPLKNTLKTLVKITDQQTLSTSVLYSKRTVFTIPKSSYNSLAQLYIKVYLSNGSQASTVETYFATKVFKSIVLKSKRGTTIQTIFPEYTQARIDEKYNTELYTYLVQGIEPDIPFASGDPTCVVPLFLCFSEDETTFLPTRQLEQLELEVVVNDTKELMGLSVDLTSISYELYALFHDTNDSNRFDDQILSKKIGIPRTLVSTYNVFSEDLLTCVSGSTSAKLLLRCPHPLYVLHMALIDSSSNRAQIKTVKLTVGGNTLIEFDYRMNYQIYGNSKSFIENGTVSLFFSKLKSRNVDSGLITFSKEMFPCYLEITYNSLASDFTLFAFEEYRTNIQIDSIGQLSFSNDLTNNALVEGFDQTNSSTAPGFFIGGGN